MKCCCLAVTTAGFLFIAGCGKSDSDGPEAFDIAAMNDSDTTRYYETSGVVRAINDSGTSMVIRHDAIPDFMSAMTMPFHIGDSTIVDGVSPGDSISFTLSVTGTDIFVDSLSVVGN